MDGNRYERQRPLNEVRLIRMYLRHTCRIYFLVGEQLPFATTRSQKANRSRTAAALSSLYPVLGFRAKNGVDWSRIGPGIAKEAWVVIGGCGGGKVVSEGPGLCTFWSSTDHKNSRWKARRARAALFPKARERARTDALRRARLG